MSREFLLGNGRDARATTRSRHGLVARATFTLLMAVMTPMTFAAEWPGGNEVWDVVTLRNYNTRIVVLGTACLGMAAGMIGSFLLLRKRALLGDALSHATLPGICLGFMVMVGLGGDGKWLPGLLLGATLTGLLGVGAILFIRHFSRLKEDAALGVVLSVFFGIGIALSGLVTQMTEGAAAGLETFIYGKTASMVAADAQLLAVAALAVAIMCTLLFKEFTLLCFDAGFAAAEGWPVRRLDLLLMAAVTAVTVVGLQAVGLILIIAMLIIPPAAARFWTESLLRMFILSAVIGALSAAAGAMISALVPELPAGAIIVLAASVCFTVSLLVGPARGLLVRLARQRALKRRVGEQHLLRSLYELLEGNGTGGGRDGAPLSQRTIAIAEVAADRSWSARDLRRLVARAARQGLVVELAEDRIRLTEAGLAEAQRVVRNHRLWEMYLITHADVAPSHVDRDADALEHVLGHEMVEKLEALLEAAEARAAPLPRSPHPIR